MAVQNDPTTHEKPKKPGKRKWTLGLLLLLSILAAVGLWQKNNIEAMVQYNKYSQEELEQQLQSNDAQVDDLLQAALEAAKQVDAEQTASDPPENKEDITSETPSEVPPADPPKSEPSKPVSVPETPKAEQTPSTPAEKPPADPAPQTRQPTAEKAPEAQKPVPSGPTYEQQLKALSDKVYALKDSYLKALDDLQAEAIAAYKAMPKEKRTGKALASFVSTYISKGNALEKQCDAKMDALVGELTQLQKKYGQSMELVNQVKYTYANEKSLKKAWYMAELQKRGFIK